MNRYDLTVKLRCPVDDALIEVAVSLESRTTVEVERLLREVSDLSAQAIMQEPFTDALFAATGCALTTVGVHGGVKITCTRGGTK